MLAGNFAGIHYPIIEAADVAVVRVQRPGVPYRIRDDVRSVVRSAPACDERSSSDRIGL